MEMINSQVKIKKNKKRRKRGLWRSRGPAAKTLAPPARKRAANLLTTLKKTVPAQVKKSPILINRSKSHK